MPSPKITYERIDRRRLIIDMRVQRPLDPNKIARFIKRGGFHPAALGVITVSQRDNGDMVILNGQHRCALAEAEGYDKPMMAEIHHGLTVAEEAALFLQLNDQTTPSAVTKFLVRIEKGDPVAVEMNRIVRSFGWHVTQAAANEGAISAVIALESIYRTAATTRPDGEHGDILNVVLAVITGAWGHTPNASNGPLMQGIAQLYGRFGGAVDTRKLMDDLKKFTPVDIHGKAKQLQSIEGGTVPAAVAKVLRGIHNNRKRTNLLPEWVWTR